MDVSPPSIESESDPKPVIITVREPKCTRCRNHGTIAKMKGHKGYCPYAMCTCFKCILVEERRRISRQQLRLRRHGTIDLQELLECKARSSTSTHQRNVSPNNLISNESGTLHPRMNWPVNFPVGPPPPPNPNCLHSTPAQSDFGRYQSPPNTHIPTPCNLNSGGSMVADSQSANLYYPPNKSSDFTPPYAHTPSGYPLSPTPTQNLTYKGFNGGPTPSCSRSWFFNSVSYNLSPVSPRIPSNRVGSCQGRHCLVNWEGTGGTTDFPTDLTEHGSSETCKLVIDTEK